MANSTFQHRHYTALADMLADAREQEGGNDTPWQRAYTDIEQRMVKLFKADNPKFSADRFERAARRAPDMSGRDKVR